MVRKKEDGFEKLARLIKEEGEDVRQEIRESEERTKRELRNQMDEGFTAIKRRLDVTIQPQLDQHARRIKDLEIKTVHLPHSRSR